MYLCMADLCLENLCFIRGNKDIGLLVYDAMLYLHLFTEYSKVLPFRIPLSRLATCSCSFLFITRRKISRNDWLCSIHLKTFRFLLIREISSESWLTWDLSNAFLALKQAMMWTLMWVHLKKISCIFSESSTSDMILPVILHDSTAMRIKNGRLNNYFVVRFKFRVRFIIVAPTCTYF